MKYIRLALLTTGLMLFALGFGVVQAQDEPLLTLLSGDPPVQFQPLLPGDSPNSAAYTSLLDIPAETEQSLISIILQNTGWSEGSLDVISEALLPDERYVALEVQPDGDGGYAPLAGGLAFELEPIEAADGAISGYRLRVVIQQKQAFAIYRVVESDGETISGQTNIRDAGSVVQETAEYVIDPEPVFGAVVLEFHIVAQAIPPAPASSAAGETGESGGWGACGSCDTCGHQGECVQSPDGQCQWDPRTCARSASQGAGGDAAPSAGGCVKATATCTGGYEYHLCPNGTMVTWCMALTDNCGTVYPGPIGPACP